MRHPIPVTRDYRGHRYGDPIRWVLDTATDPEALSTLQRILGRIAVCRGYPPGWENKAVSDLLREYGAAFGAHAPRPRFHVFEGKVSDEVSIIFGTAESLRAAGVL